MGIQSARSTNWKDAVELSKSIQMPSDSAKVISEVQSAVIRALRATVRASPRTMNTNSAPTVGRKITRLRIGQPVTPVSHQPCA